MSKVGGWFGVVLMAALAAVLATQGRLDAQANDRYSYVYQGKVVRLTPSPSLIAIRGGSAVAGSELAAKLHLSVDKLSAKPAFSKNGVKLYRVPSEKGATLRSATAMNVALKSNLEAQPVFEQGGGVLVPADEVIVGFKADTTLAAARRFLAGYSNRFGLTGVRSMRPNTFVVGISAPADGRVFAVSRRLAKVPGIAFAEPNFVIGLVHGEAPEPKKTPSLDGPLRPTGVPLEGTDARVPPQPLAEIAASPTWQTLISEGFEGAVNGWSNILAQGATDATPAVTTFKKRSGTKSLYLTGGGTQGVPPPGPYPDNCFGGIQSPPLNLAQFEEAYVECWFYAKFEDPGEQIFDLAALLMFDPNTGQQAQLSAFVVSYTGDLTADPTTKAGWRRVLGRIPPSHLVNGAAARFLIRTDEAFGAEGVYVDDVRIVGTTNVDTQPLGNDTYGGRAYELQNVGQMAALGNDGNDLNCPEAWAIQPVSQNVVVAVIDDGVELTHPDLNLVAGYNADGSPGGGPASNDDNHGTACAGNVGAIRNNSIGTIGTAPGVKIMPVNRGGTAEGMATSIDVAVQRGAKVLSNSWGFVGAPLQAVTDAIAAALAANRIVLFAAGNGPDRPPFTYQTAFPGNLTANMDIITVGASSPTDEHKATASSDGIHSWGSSYVGAGPDVCSPGPWSYTTDRLGANGYNGDQAQSGINVDYTHDFGGTSSSTPKVAGIVALMCSKDSNLTPAQAKAILKSTAKDIETAGADDKTGSGRVDALKAVQAVSGGNGTITVTSPNGGENWQLGTVHNITWNSSNVSGNVKIEVSVNGGNSYTQVVGSTANDGTHPWTVAGTASTNCRIRVSQASNAAVSDVSNAAFTISAATNATVTVISPNGGENWQVGTSRNITWDSENLSGNVKIEISRDGGGSFAVLFAGTANDGTQAWTVAGAASTNCVIRISQASNAAVNDTSDDTFTIAAAGNPSVTVMTPNGGENWQIGTSQTINWDSTDLTGNVKIELSRNGGGSFEVLFNSTGNDGSQAWTVAGATSTNCIIRISHATNATVNDTSDGSFTIAAAGNPTATPTNLSAEATSKSTLEVTWTDNAVGEDGYKLEYRVGNGSFQQIPDLLPADSESASLTGATPSTTYTFRVRCYKGASNSAYSNTDTVTTPAPPLAAPTNLLAKAVKKVKIKLTWVDNSDGEEGFAVEIDDGSGFREIGVASANSRGATITGLKKKRFYAFRIRAKKGSVYSDYSNTAGAKTKKK